MEEKPQPPPPLLSRDDAAMISEKLSDLSILVMKHHGIHYVNSLRSSTSLNGLDGCYPEKEFVIDLAECSRFKPFSSASINGPGSYFHRGSCINLLFLLDGSQQRPSFCHHNSAKDCVWDEG